MPAVCPTAHDVNAAKGGIKIRPRAGGCSLCTEGEWEKRPTGYSSSLYPIEVVVAVTALIADIR